MSKEELVGVDFDINFEGGKAIVVVKHVGSDGSVELKGSVDAKKVLGKVIDKIEEVIPGDQKQYAALIKAAIANLEIK